MLKVKNWDRYQHYKDRCPPWIKLATDTFQDYKFGKLRDASKLLAICIWTLAARTKTGTVPNDLDWIIRQGNLGKEIVPSHLQELIIAGFLVADSNVLADCEQTACSETERETEEREKKTVPSRGPKAYPQPFEDVWRAAGGVGRLGNSNKWEALRAWEAVDKPAAEAVTGRWKQYLDSLPAWQSPKHFGRWLKARGHEQEYRLASTDDPWGHMRGRQ